MTELRDDPFYRALLDEETAALDGALGPSAPLEDRVVETLRDLDGGGPSGGGGSSSGAGFALAAAAAVVAAGLVAFWPARTPAPTAASPVATAVVETSAPSEGPSSTTGEVGVAEVAGAEARPGDPAPPPPTSVVDDDDKPRGHETVAKVARAQPPPRPTHDATDAPPATATTAPTTTTSAGEPEQAAPTSRLAEQLFAYDAAQYALTRGRFDVAVLMFTEFLEAYPDSDLRAEAELSRLEALVRSGDHKEAARFAEVLSKDEARPRRGDILRLQADSLTALGACDRAAWVYKDALRLGARGLSEDDVERADATCR